MIRYSDNEIHQLIQEPQRPLSAKYKLRLKSKGAHEEQDIELEGTKGNRFRLLLRRSRKNSLDFSVILAYCPSETSKEFRLCRYNGKHQHTNNLEKQSFDDFHIHHATERYQEIGAKEETYAEQTDRFSDLESALQCLINDCVIIIGDDKQPWLF